MHYIVHYIVHCIVHYMVHYIGEHGTSTIVSSPRMRSPMTVASQAGLRARCCLRGKTADPVGVVPLLCHSDPLGVMPPPLIPLASSLPCVHVRARVRVYHVLTE